MVASPVLQVLFPLIMLSLLYNYQGIVYHMSFIFQWPAFYCMMKMINEPECKDLEVHMYIK